jgi:two-component system sensor histidine kinase MprB
MPLRKRVSLAAAGAVALAVAVAVVVCYGVVRGQLRAQITSELTSQYDRIVQSDGFALSAGTHLPGNSADQGGDGAPYVWFIASNGSWERDSGNLPVPHTGLGKAVASGRRNDLYADTSVRGTPLRVFLFQAELTNPANGQRIPIAVELGRPLTQVASLLAQLRVILLILFLAGVALAAGLGRLAARRVLRPLAEVSDTAKTIGETDDLSLRLAVHADDEVGQLATRFNAMLERLEESRAALDESVRSQRQLVADASHELRTPVTSLRTNIEVLLDGGFIDEEDRRRLLADVVEQSEELTGLVSDLIEVARGDLPNDSMEEVRLDGIVEECVARAQRHAPDVSFEAQLEPTLIRGNPERLSRAINNLLDNAAKHSGTRDPVEITIDNGRLTVRDHGTGIDEADLPHVFDRFYRGANSRARQGSGLGLAIVRQVAEQNGGTVAAANAPGGGAVFTLTLPVLSAEGAGGSQKRAYGAGGLAARR